MIVGARYVGIMMVQWDRLGNACSHVSPLGLIIIYKI